MTNIKTHSAHYSVQGGEELKSVKHLPSHLESIFKIIHNAQIRKPTFVGIGGGSVSDFTGFIASIYQRGVAFDLVPTTWLAAVDSAHGGKNALNLESHKNQIGTFHLARNAILCKDILLSEPIERFQEACSEIVKIQLLTGTLLNLEFTPETIYSSLPQLIEAKMKLVQLALYDQKQIRAQLNFGHTLGHALELACELSHGTAVNLGMRFSIEWSRHLNILEPHAIVQINSKLQCLTPPRSIKLKSMHQLKEILLFDKKLSSTSKLNFIFLKDIGHPVVRAVDVNEILEEVNRQQICEFYEDSTL